MSTPKPIRWRTCGEESRGRVGSIEGTSLTVDIHYSHFKRRYSIVFAGVTRDREFSEIGAAKRFAEEHVSTWLEEHKVKLEADKKRAEEERTEHLAMTRELEGVVTRLADHGIPCRAMGGVFLRLDVAKKVAGMLDQLKTIEERGAV